MELRIRLLGGFRLSKDTNNTIGLGCRKSQELLGYLLLNRGRAGSREVVTESIWPDSAGESGRKRVRQALWNIHQTVDPTSKCERLVLSNGDSLTLNPRRDWWCDAVEFTRSIDQHLSRPADPVLDRQLDETLELYGGALLDGCYSEWCLVERERLDTIHLLGLDAAADRAEFRADHWQAVSWSNTLLRVDPAHERTHQRLMRLHYAAGDRTRALQQFERCRRALEDELGIKPSALTVELYRAIRDDQDAPTTNSLRHSRGNDRPVEPEPVGPSASIAQQLAEIHQRLDVLSRSLAEHS